MNLCIIGPSGSGKGTQCALLARRPRLVHLSTGDLFRRNVLKQTALGLLARKYMDACELVPDVIVESMVEDEVRNSARDARFVFDGFPRTIEQARFLDELFTSLGQVIGAAVYLNLSDSIAVSRLKHRLVCSACQAAFNSETNPALRPGRCDHCGSEIQARADDSPALIASRLAAFRRSAGQVLDHYRRNGRLRIVEANADKVEVQRRILASLGMEALQEPALTRIGSHPSPFDGGRPDSTIGSGEVPSRYNLVLIGGPGSGKGTQAEALGRALTIPHISTGALFREHIRNQTQLGILAQSYMNRGELVPDEITEEMVRDRLSQSDTSKGFILDGFPRTLAQAQSLDEMLGRLHRSVGGVIAIDVGDASIVERLSGRLICRDCQTPFHLQFHPPSSPGRCDRCGGTLCQREDDRPETIRARLKTYHSQTGPLLAYYRDAGMLRLVPGEGNVQMVTGLVMKSVNEITNGNRSRRHQEKHV